MCLWGNIHVIKYTMLERFRWHLAWCCENYVSVNHSLAQGGGRIKYFVPTDPQTENRKNWYVMVSERLCLSFIYSFWMTYYISVYSHYCIAVFLPSHKRNLVSWLLYCKRLGMSWAVLLISLCINSVPVSNLMLLLDNTTQQPHTQAIKHEALSDYTTIVPKELIGLLHTLTLPQGCCLKLNPHAKF